MYDPTELIANNERRVRQARAAGDSAEEGNALIDLACSQNLVGRSVEARENARAAGQIFARGRHPEKEVEALCIEAASLGAMGQYAEALKVAQSALTLASNLENGRCEAFARGNVGLALSNLHRLDEAILEYETCLKLIEKTGEDNFTALTLRGMAAVYLRKGDRARCLDLMEQGASLSMSGYALLQYQMFASEIEAIKKGINPFEKPRTSCLPLFAACLFLFLVVPLVFH